VRAGSSFSGKKKSSGSLASSGSGSAPRLVTGESVEGGDLLRAGLARTPGAAERKMSSEDPGESLAASAGRRGPKKSRLAETLSPRKGGKPLLRSGKSSSSVRSCTLQLPCARG